MSTSPGGRRRFQIIATVGIAVCLLAIGGKLVLDRVENRRLDRRTVESLAAEARAYVEAEEQNRPVGSLVRSAGTTPADPDAGPAHPPIPESVLYENGAMTDAEEDAYLEALDDTDHEAEMFGSAVDSEAGEVDQMNDVPARVVGGASAVTHEISYPAEARRRGYEGSVTMIVSVGTNGKPGWAEVAYAGALEPGTDAYDLLTGEAFNTAMRLRYEVIGGDASYQRVVVPFYLNQR